MSTIKYAFVVAVQLYFISSSRHLIVSFRCLTKFVKYVRVWCFSVVVVTPSLPKDGGMAGDMES